MDTRVCDFSYLFSPQYINHSFYSASICRHLFYLYVERKKIRDRVKRANLTHQQTGAILQKTNIILANTTTTTTTSDSLEDADEEQQDSIPETKVLQELATFDQITVYGHEVQPDAQEDVYVKGINEWISLAGAVSYSFLCRWLGFGLIMDR